MLTKSVRGAVNVVRSLIVCVLIGLVSSAYAQQPPPAVPSGTPTPLDEVSKAACTGSFPNYITGVCWQCVFPIKVFGNVTLVNSGQEDAPTITSRRPVCNCGLSLGIPISFWEPARMMDVTKIPYCFVNMGGMHIPAGPNRNQFAGKQEVTSPMADGLLGNKKRSFWHVHYYINPLMLILDVITDSKCLDQKGFDVFYLSEIDPTHDDPDLENLLTPDVYLFANIAAIAACSADCAAASIGFPLNSLFWCAGCNGYVYPFIGAVTDHGSNLQATSLIAQRITTKLHRVRAMLGALGSDGLCGYYEMPIMDKRQYKYSYIEPIAQSSGSLNGVCCQPFGRSTATYGLDLPGRENYGVLLFRKRDCCEGLK